MLRRFTGSDAFGFTHTVMPGSSRVEPGVTPATPQTFSYATFSAAVDEAGISRRYGGIHFSWGDTAARTLGRRVGAQVWTVAQSYINGTASRIQQGR